jgi:hypothetical protein
VAELTQNVCSELFQAISANDVHRIGRSIDGTRDTGAVYAKSFARVRVSDAEPLEVSPHSPQARGNHPHVLEEFSGISCGVEAEATAPKAEQNSFTLHVRRAEREVVIDQLPAL